MGIRVGVIVLLEKNIREDEMSRRSRERRRRSRSSSRSYSRSRSRSRSRTPRRHSPRRDRYRQKNENTGPNPYFVARRDERNKIIETSRLECCGKSPRPITDDSDDEKSNLIVKRERFASSDHDRKRIKRRRKNTRNNLQNQRKKNVGLKPRSLMQFHLLLLKLNQLAPNYPRPCKKFIR